MKKKVVLTAAATALAGTLAVGGTLAWFTDTEEATNVVTMGEIDITLEEDGGSDGVVKNDGLTYDDIMPGDVFQKTVTMENLENDAYVRATITVDATDTILDTFNGNNALVFKDLVIPDGTNWAVDKEAGTATLTLYYTDEDNIMVKDDIWQLFSAIEVPGSWGNDFVNENFTIKVNAEAIQADNLTEEEAWNEFDGIETPDLKDAEGKAKYDAATPAEAD